MEINHLKYSISTACRCSCIDVKRVFLRMRTCLIGDCILLLSTGPDIQEMLSKYFFGEKRLTFNHRNTAFIRQVHTAYIGPRRLCVRYPGKHQEFNCEQNTVPVLLWLQSPREIHLEVPRGTREGLLRPKHGGPVAKQPPAQRSGPTESRAATRERPDFTLHVALSQVVPRSNDTVRPGSCRSRTAREE